MKYLGISYGKIVEGFTLIPGISINWMWHENKKYYDVQFAWLFWYFTIGCSKKICDNFFK